MERSDTQPADGAPREVMAHFTTAYVVLLWFVALCLIAAYALWVRSAFFAEPAPFSVPAKSVIAMAGHAVDIWGLLILGGGLAFMLISMCAVTYATVVNRGAALWIEKGRLVYVYRRVLDAPMTEIAFVGLTQLPIYYGILRTKYKSVLTVRLKNGKDVYLPTRYSEGTDEVITRLRQRIGLPAA